MCRDDFGASKRVEDLVCLVERVRIGLAIRAIAHGACEKSEWHHLTLQNAATAAQRMRTHGTVPVDDTSVAKSMLIPIALSGGSGKRRQLADVARVVLDDDRRVQIRRNLLEAIE